MNLTSTTPPPESPMPVFTSLISPAGADRRVNSRFPNITWKPGPWNQLIAVRQPQSRNTQYVRKFLKYPDQASFSQLCLFSRDPDRGEGMLNVWL